MRLPSPTSISKLIDKMQEKPVGAALCIALVSVLAMAIVAGAAVFKR
jgi:hypothetical protein